ncbi:MAG: serine hydrolase [Bryobacteraceae bacterium]|nr:serine hydrolase [Bryobacteraceae bacterium]
MTSKRLLTALFLGSLSLQGAGEASPLVVSSASYRAIAAPGSAASILGQGLATVIASTSAASLPLEISGTSVAVTDAVGISRPAPLYFVSPSQINLEIPAGTKQGRATLAVKSATGTQTATFDVSTVSPALFSADGSGAGLAAAQVLTINRKGTQVLQSVYTIDPLTSRQVARPVIFEETTDRAFLILYATGLRGRASLSSITVMVGGQQLQPTFAGPQGSFPGLDQVNLELPLASIDDGVLNISLGVDGVNSNVVTAEFGRWIGAVLARPNHVYLNAAPGPSGNPGLAMIYAGWKAVPTAAAYIVRLAVTGRPAEDRMVAAPQTSFSLAGLPAGAVVTATVLTVNAQGGQSVPSSAVSTVMPAPPTAAECANYRNAAVYSDAQKGEAVLVFRNGQIVFEHYAGGYDGSTPHALASGTKSFTSAFQILAAQDGFLRLSDLAKDVIPEWNDGSYRSRVTLLDLLSLSSGLAPNPAYSAVAVSRLDTYQLSVERSSGSPPDQVFVYDPLAFQNFALIFQIRSGGVYLGDGKVTGGLDPIDYLQTKLFRPIGVTLGPRDWQRDMAGHPQMAGGANLTARDWLKYGQLVLQKGTWLDRRILDADMLANCTGGFYNRAYAGYGITWWLNKHNNGTYDPGIDQVPRDGQPEDGSDQISPHVPEDMFLAAGTGKERLYVIPSLNIAVVRFAPLNSGGPASTWSDDTFLGKLIGTVK